MIVNNFSLDPKDLIKELKFELTIRGIQPSDTCKVLVKLLREFLLLEKSGKIFTSLRLLDHKYEIEICKSKLD